jgi:hypothetical protein
MSETPKRSDVNCVDGVNPAPPPRAPRAYEPPAIELRMPLETTAAFCDVAMNGKEFPVCQGPINS